MSHSGDIRIAVDARPLCHAATGISRYTTELLTRMSDMGGEWYLYSPQPYDRTGLHRENIVHRSGNVPGYLGGSQASQLLFPRWTREDAIDVFWGPRHHLPLRLPADIRAVLTVHDLVWKQQAASMRASRRWSERLLMPRSVRRADWLVTGSNAIASELEANFPGVHSRLSVIPYASGFDNISRGSEKPMDESRYFLFVGTMEPRKNLPRLMRAYKAYTVRVASARALKIVGGDGWGGIDPDKLVHELELGGKVEVLGKVSDESLATLYRDAFALLMPSLYEGFGLPVVEAMAHGVPVIVSQDSAPSEVAAGAGYQVDPMSQDDICRALCALTLDEALYLRLYAQALPRARHFSWKTSAEQMYILLRNGR
jgi:glycosyltransferase involved in cell wall biosynthesis